tara:strand:- start:3429 stop:3947 length:519 start_codon:yes stop_codon:yes gene_type:complete
MPVKISQLSKLHEAPAGDDLLEIDDVSAALSKSMTVDNFADYTENALVYMRARTSTGQVLTANVTLLDYSGSIVDPTGSWNGTNTFTAPHDGHYHIIATCSTTTASNNSIRALINGTGDIYGVNSKLANSSPAILIYTFNLLSGDTVTFTYTASETRNNIGYQNVLTIVEIG